MLDLNARVHLHEIETTVFIEQKFERARTCIANRLRRLQRSLTHLLTQLRSHHWRRRFFEQLLMPALNWAFALAEIDTSAVFVRHYLDFNVPRTLDVTFDINITVLECCCGFSRCGFQRVRHFIFWPNYAHAATTATTRSLDDDRVANLARQRYSFIRRLNCAFAAGQNRHAGFPHRIARRNLFAHQTNHVGARADKLDVAGLADFGEVSGFGQEPISRVNRVDVEDFRGADDRWNVQVALRGRRRTNADGLVGKPHMKRIAVDFAVHRDRANAHLFARPDNATGNLAAIGDQNFAEATHDSVSSQQLAVSSWRNISTGHCSLLTAH